MLLLEWFIYFCDSFGLPTKLKLLKPKEKIVIVYSTRNYFIL